MPRITIWNRAPNVVHEKNKLKKRSLGKRLHDVKRATHKPKLCWDIFNSTVGEQGMYKTESWHQLDQSNLAL